MQTKRWIPWTMVALRAVLGPVVMVGEQRHWNGLVLATIVLAALLSDIFDGVLARRWKTDTAALRLSDSLADTVFYLGVVAAIGLNMPAVWHEYRGGVLVVLACELVRLIFELIKFGKPASYHSYLAKTWGLILAVAVILTFATQHVSPWMFAAVVMGVVCNAETLAMSIILPMWRRDVNTLAMAWRMRAGWMRARTQAGAAIGLALVLGLMVQGGRAARAQTLRNVTYVGGTAFKSNGLQGRLSILSPEELVFEGPAKLAIPYDHVISYESSKHKKVHVGLLTEGVWRLVAPWPEGKRLSLCYRDAGEHPQVVVLEMSRGDEALLVEVLKARVPRPTPRQSMTPPHPPAIVPERPTDH